MSDSEPTHKHPIKSKTIQAGGACSVVAALQTIMPDGLLTEDQLVALLGSLGPIFAVIRHYTTGPLTTKK